MKALISSLLLSILIAAQPAAAMIALKDRLGRNRRIPHEEDWMRDIRVRIEAEKIAEKFWAQDLGRRLPPALMPHLENNKALVDLVGMSASKYYPRQVQDELQK